MQAVIITYFDQENYDKLGGKGISLEYLANELKSHPNYIRQKMFYWLHNGVVKEEKASIRGSANTPGFSAQTNAYFKHVESMYQSDSIVYFLVDTYNGYGEVEGFEATEHESISKFSNINKTSDESENSLQTLILTILNTNGPKTAEKIYFLMKTVYKPKGVITLSDSDFKEI